LQGRGESWTSITKVLHLSIESSILRKRGGSCASITNRNSYNIFRSVWLGPSRDGEGSNQSRIIKSNPCEDQLFYISKIWYDFLFLWWYVLITSTSLLLVLIGCRWNIRCPNFTPLHFQSHLGLFMGRRIFGEMLIKTKYTSIVHLVHMEFLFVGGGFFS
jgi:hypothetical protein